MKRTLAIIALAALVCTAQAQISTVTTNYFTNTAFIASGDSWSNSYSGVALVFDVAELNELTDAQSSNDFRAVIFNMMLYLYDQIQALASTNRPVNFTVYQSTGSSGSSDYTVQHAISTHQNIGTITIPSEE